MNKSDLIKKIAQNSGISKDAAAQAIDITVGSITAALRKGDRVALVGFGTFSVGNRKARSGRNPATGERANIVARRVARFSPDRKLKKAVGRESGAGKDAFVSSLEELSDFY